MYSRALFLCLLWERTLCELWLPLPLGEGWGEGAVLAPCRQRKQGLEPRLLDAALPEAKPRSQKNEKHEDRRERPRAQGALPQKRRGKGEDYPADCAAKYLAGGCPKLLRNIATNALTLA